ncbi:MAG: DUF881 domain-containing protein [Clostridia bacterium]|nr:DUF881 domain-containing protein [Clostridia bacterium]
MKKGKVTMIFTISIACFALTLVMFMQFKIVNETDITSIETMREEELRTELANWKQKYEETKQQYDKTHDKIEEYKEKKENNIETAVLVNEELQQSNILLGKTDLVGEGIEITIKEVQFDDYSRDPNEDFSKIQDSDLLLIVNSLKNAGAEAISINEERIINMSDIAYIGSTFIKVNGQRILSPYIIKAIGNKSYLESSLLGNGGAAEQLKKMGHDVQIIQSDNVLVKKYSGDINYKYITD